MQGDLHFSLFGVPVRVNPMFWVVSVLLGFRLGDPTLVIMWMLCVFVSILVHEFGHVLAFGLFGHPARIVLYAMGGLAIPDAGHGGWQASSFRRGARQLDGWPHVIVSLAGPAAGFVLAGVVVASLYVGGVSISCPFFFDLELGHGDPIQNRNLANIVLFLLFSNVLWGLANVLPLYPLDGGQVARELFLMFDAGQGIRRSLVLSIVTGTAVAVGMLAWQGRDGAFTAIMCGILAYDSYVALAAYTGRGGGFGGGYRDGGAGGGRDW
jgi:Zn-dependent protease